MNRIVTFFLLLILLIPTVQGHLKWQKLGINPEKPVCYASGKVEKTFIPPPVEVLNRLKSASEKKSEIQVTYYLFPEQAKTAFDYAVSIWENIVESPVPIYIRATWLSKNNNILGSCGPEDYYANFENAPFPGLYYPVVLAEKITGKEISGPDKPDMVAEFNKNINWYFGIDGQTPDSLYDFVSVVLHEIGHGLGFNGFFFVEGGDGAYGFYNYGDVSSFDQMVVKINDERLVDTTLYKNPSVLLKSALESNALYMKSPAAIFDNNGAKPRLYAPSVWDGGSSIYHLNDAIYPSGNINSLMTHSIGRGEAIHDPGPITQGIMADIGWKNLIIQFDQLKDIETVQPLVFNVEIKSDYPLDTTALFIPFSYDGFKSHNDTISLKQAGNDFYTATLTPSPENTGEIHYYIHSADIKNRVFTLPSDAPSSLYSVKIGADNEPPAIVHKEIPFYLFTRDKLDVRTQVDDNVGVDTVYIEYMINGEPQSPFGLDRLEKTAYSGFFNFGGVNLKDGDVISYHIIARDASVKQNTSRIPVDSTYSFRIEKIFDPLTAYVNDFNNPTNDFIIKDFSVYKAFRFNDGALHSPHPYPSPEQDNASFDLITILKYPVILKENGKMSFDEIVLVEPGEDFAMYGDDDFWDYVIIEGSKDNGNTWLPVINGYDSGNNNLWETTYNQKIVDQYSTSPGTSELFVNREINLTGNGNFSAGDTVLFRFRLFSDPYAHGWGWAIDNLRIQSAVSAPLTVLSPGNIQVYPNPFTQNLHVSLDPLKTISEVQIDLRNATGQVIYSTLIHDLREPLTHILDPGEISPGIYLLTVREKGKVITSKKIIRK